jgi:hypothetical protein
MREERCHVVALRNRVDDGGGFMSVVSCSFGKADKEESSRFAVPPME